MTSEGCKGQRNRFRCANNCLELILIKTIERNILFFLFCLGHWMNSFQKLSSLTSNSTYSSEALRKKCAIQTQAGCEKSLRMLVTEKKGFLASHRNHAAQVKWAGFESSLLFPIRKGQKTLEKEKKRLVQHRVFGIFLNLFP